LPTSADNRGQATQPAAGNAGAPLTPATQVSALPEEEPSSSGQKRSRKARVPDWARSTKLENALTRQFYEGRDPDTIFPPFVDMETGMLNLHSIFDSVVLPEDRRFSNRSSSGNWKLDGLKPQEQLDYNREMGFFEAIAENA